MKFINIKAANHQPAHENNVRFFWIPVPTTGICYASEFP